MQIKPIPVQASLTFYHHFYVALWSGSYITSAMEYAKYQMQNDTRFGRYWCNFVLLGLDTFVNLTAIKHDMLHQTMENIEQEVHQSRKQDWLNPAPFTAPVPDQEALLLEIQKCLEELIVNQGSMSSVLKLLHLLMTEAIKRLSPANTDNVTVKLTANIIGIPGVSSMLSLLGFRFQSLAPHPTKVGDRIIQLASEQAAIGDVSNHSTRPISHAHPVAVIFPHWNPDRLIGVAQQAIAALIDLSVCSQCVNALIWILPLTCDRLEQLITLLEMFQSSPTVCPKLTEKEVATLWNQPHFRDFLQVIGYEQAGLYLFHNPRDLNKSLLLGSLSLFLALRPQPLQSVAFSKLDPEQNSSASVREQQSRQDPQETSELGKDQSTQDSQETSAPGEEQSRQDPQETSALGKDQSTQDPQETSAPGEEQSTQDPQETSALGEEQSTQDPQQTSAQTDEGPQETSALQDQSRQDPQESSADTVRNKKARQSPQESLTDTARDKKTRQGPQESSTDTVRDKKARHGPQETPAAGKKKNRYGPLETAAARSKRTRHGPQEGSGVSDKQSEQDTQETAADHERTTYPSGKSKVHLNTLKPLLVLRHQIMMQAPWLTVKPTSEEVRVKHNLAQRLNSLHSQQQAHMHCMELWHKKALRELEKKPEKRRNKKQDCTPKKVKVKGPRTPSTAQIPFDTPTPVSHNVALRSSAQEIIKEQEENVRHRHRAAVKDLFLPFIDPLP